MRRRALLMGGQKEESAFIPLLNTLRFNLSVSTRSGRVFVDWGDSTNQEITHFKNTDYTNYVSSLPSNSFTQKDYSLNFTGNVEVIFKKGLKDVYSIAIYKFTRGNTPADEVTDKYNISDVGAFLNQFPNLYSVRLTLYGYGTTAKRAAVYGDLALIPNWIKKLSVTSCDVIGFPDTLYLDLDKYMVNSDLEFFHQENSTTAGGQLNKLKIIGDLKNLPSNIQYFKVIAPHPTLSTFTYTSGRIWRADYDTFYINKVLTDTENDNILIDLADSVTTAIGDKVIYLRGSRTSASDSAVSYLEGLGFTVTITP